MARMRRNRVRRVPIGAVMEAGYDRRMRKFMFAPIFAAALSLSAPAAWAANGSLEVCGSLSARAADVIHHCRRAVSQGGLSKQQLFAVNLNLGDALVSSGRNAEAKDAFAAAAATGLERVELYLGLAAAEEGVGDARAAAANLDRALKLNSRSMGVRLARGAYFLRAGRADAALAEYDAAVRLDREDANALYNRGLALIALGRGADAAADFSSVIRQYPNDSGAYYNRARALEGRDMNAALGDYEKAATLSPEWPAPVFAAGKLLDGAGRTEDANFRFRRAFELGMRDPWLLSRIRSLGG